MRSIIAHHGSLRLAARSSPISIVGRPGEKLRFVKSSPVKTRIHSRDSISRDQRTFVDRGQAARLVVTVYGENFTAKISITIFVAEKRAHGRFALIYRASVFFTRIYIIYILNFTIQRAVTFSSIMSMCFSATITNWGNFCCEIFSVKRLFVKRANRLSVVATCQSPFSLFIISMRRQSDHTADIRENISIRGSTLAFVVFALVRVDSLIYRLVARDSRGT